MKLIFREICPSDFYWFSLVENDYPDISQSALSLLIMVMLLDIDEDDEETLNLIPKRCVGPILDWVMKELVTEKIMKVEQWLEMAFHLCKQRWDDSIEWLERQPISKVLLMTKVQSGFNIAQEREMKKASRKK